MGSLLATAESIHLRAGCRVMWPSSPVKRWRFPSFSAPGAFQIDLQESDTDTDAAYATIGSITCVNLRNCGCYDYQTTGRYRCVNLVSRMNSVPLTANINLE